MANNCLYTAEEIKDFIKSIDLDLNSGVQKSDLDTGQSRQSFTQSPTQLARQREYWLSLLKVVDPACYASLKGPSAIQFKGPSC